MANLKRLLGTKQVQFNETNLEKGKVWVYTSTTTQGTCLYPGNCFCWIAPANGVATVEVWGPGGSGGRLCCCGSGVPGNPGAYAKKVVRVSSGCFIYGFPGLACGNADAINFRGCSHPSYFCWFGNSGNNGFVCAQGGMGGFSYCISANSIYCCFVANGWCNTASAGAGCGWICNRSSGQTWEANAFGGDVNCAGGISCVYFGHCNPCCICFHCYYVRTSPNIFSDKGSYAIYTADVNVGGGSGSGASSSAFFAALNALSREPRQGMPFNQCWASGGTFCGCYDYSGCFPYLSTGVPAPSVHVTPDVRDVGLRGGQGAVRIRFVQD